MKKKKVPDTPSVRAANMSNPFDEEQADAPAPDAAVATKSSTGSVGQSTVTTVEEDDAASIPSHDNLYTPSTSPCSPLVQLQMYGMCCPFLETEEEHDARIGAHHLQSYPIIWYRTKRVRDVARDVRGGIDNVSKEAGGIFGGIVTNFDRLMGKNSPSSASLPMTYVGVPSLLSIIDSEDHGPVIEIRAKEELDGGKTDSLSNSDTQDEKREAKIGHATISIQQAEPAPRPWWEEPELKSSPPAKVIPLYLIDKVTCGYSLFGDATAGGIKLFGAPPANTGMFSSGAELLRFDTLGGGGNVLSDWLFPIKAEEPNKYSNKVIDQLKSLVAWNRRRIANDIEQGKARIAPKGNGGDGLVVS